MAHFGDVMGNETGGHCNFRWSKWEKDQVASDAPADCSKAMRFSFDFYHFA